MAAKVFHFLGERYFLEVSSLVSKLVVALIAGVGSQAVLPLFEIFFRFHMGLYHRLLDLVY